MPSPAIIIGVVFMCFCLVAIGFGIYFATQSSASPAPAPSPAPSPAPAAPVGSPSVSPSPGTPSGTPSSTYRLTPDTIAYRGDSNLGSKTIKTVTGDVNTCKSSCDGTSDCTHFERMGNSCTLYRGAEWVGGMPGGQSYCKAQCQQ